MKRINILLLSTCISCLLFAQEKLDYYEPFMSSLGQFTTFTEFPKEVQPREDEVIWRFNIRYGMIASNENDPIFTNAKSPIVSWAVSPSITIPGEEGSSLQFIHAMRYSDNASSHFRLLITTDIDSTVPTAHWQELSIPTIPDGQKWIFVPTGSIPLDTYKGKTIRIAFQYRANGEDTLVGWDVRDFLLSHKQNLRKVYKGTCGEQLTWTLRPQTGILTIEGEGAMEDGCVCSELAAYVRSIVLPEGLETIGKRAFLGFSYVDSIAIPSTVKSIGKEAFRKCASLRQVVVPKSVDSIGTYAFAQCNQLQAIWLPSTLRVIPKNMCWQDYSLTHVGIPVELQHIDDYAFSDCISLKDVTLPKGITYGKKPFFNCYELHWASVVEAKAEKGTPKVSQPEKTSHTYYATFPGGNKAFNKYLNDNIVYPPHRIGGTVRYKVVVAPTGDVKEVRVIESSGHQILDDAVVRPLRKMPKWTPAEDLLHGMDYVIERDYTFFLSDNAQGETFRAVRKLTYNVIDEEGNPIAEQVNPEQLPRPINGINDLIKTLNSHAQYPAEALTNGIEGSGIARFDVEKNGKISNPAIVQSTGNESLDEAALRILQFVPAWSPASNKKKAVRIRCYVHFTFEQKDIVR
ncbi:MAG: TonB family protein [Paludibacteraceae bacterium]